MLEIATMCLAISLYYEAAGEPFDGKVAVAEVILNRVASPKYPNDICSVVYQPKQFSYVGAEMAVMDPEDFREILILADSILSGETEVIGHGATHYHSTKVDPVWNRQMQYLGNVGAHLFWASRSYAPQQSPEPKRRVK